MRKIIALFIALIFTIGLYAQNEKEVQVKGVGMNREDAIQDGLRAAVGKAVGVAVSSETQMENFLVLKDAVSTNTKGYIISYDIIEETPLADRHEVKIKAKVSLEPLKADIQLLTKQIGGVRFLVMFDKRKIDQSQKDLYNFAVERINNHLSQKQYRYIEKSRFERLQEEAYKIMQETDTSTMTFVQKLGLLSGAEFIILINKIHTNTKEGVFGTHGYKQVVIEAKAYDNCTAEGLGTAILKSGYNTGGDESNMMRKGIGQAIDKEFDKLLAAFTSYIGNWVNNGIPYELRFYQVGSFRDFRNMRNKIKNGHQFAGQIQITNVYNYTKLNCTFKTIPDELAFKILDYADQIEGFKEKKLDVLLFYGRQISFAPQDVVVPGIEKSKNIMNH